MRFNDLLILSCDIILISYLRKIVGINYDWNKLNH